MLAVQPAVFNSKSDPLIERLQQVRALAAKVLGNSHLNPKALRDHLNATAVSLEEELIRGLLAGDELKRMRSRGSI